MPWRSSRALAIVTILAAVYSLVVLVIPTRGLTFVVDDWEHLFRITRTPWPERWLKIAMEHWSPLFWILLEIKVRLLGATSPFPFVVFAWANHAVNVWLVGRLVLGRTGDERSAAVVAAVFGFTTQYRALIWWGFSLTAWTPCFTFSVLGFIALDRFRESGRGLALASACVLVAPLFMGAGLALGPILFLDAFTIQPERRRRALVAIGAAFLLYLALFVPVLATSDRPRLFPRDAHELGLAIDFGARLAGLMTAGGVLLAPVQETEAEGGRLFLAVYVGLVALAIALARTREERARIVILQGHVAIVAALIALSRWSFGIKQASESRYEYMPVIAWSVPLGVIVRATFERNARATLAVSIIIIVSLAVGHANAAWSERGRYSPRARRDHPVFIEHLRAAVANAKGPVYDALLPEDLALPSTRAAIVYALVAPDRPAVFTTWRTEETVRPYASDPVLAPLLRSR